VRAGAHGPHAHGQLAAVAFTDDEPLLAEPLMRIVEGLGAALVRAKGFVSLAGEPRRAFLERAGARTALRLEEPWGERARRTELVLIGEGLDGDALRRQLWACRARRS
jgi:G3E family GTPase